MAKDVYLGQVLERRELQDGRIQERKVLDYCLCHQQKPPVCWSDKWFDVKENDGTSAVDDG